MLLFFDCLHLVNVFHQCFYKMIILLIVLFKGGSVWTGTSEIDYEHTYAEIDETDQPEYINLTDQ